MKKIIFYISLFIIVLYWIYLRVYELWTWSFWIDEWYSSIISYFSYLNNFIPYLPTDNYNFSNYLFTFFQTISYKIYWINDIWARVPSVFFWILNIFIYYLFSKELLKNNKYKYLWLLFLIFIFIFSTWQIIWTREARFYELLSFIYLLDIFLLWKYIEKKEFLYLFWFLVIWLFGIIFHVFCFWLIIIWTLVFLYITLIDKQKKSYLNLLWIIVILLIYIIIKYWINYLSTWWWTLTNVIPIVNSLKEFNFINNLWLYINNLYNELWIIVISYLFWISYLIYNKDIKKFIIFWLLVIFNILVLSYWHMAHTRYMYHIYSIIILFWWYSLFNLFEYLIWKYKSKYYYILFIFSIILFIWFYYTYKITLIPQRYYYIDYTSPKPNFKRAYNYLKTNFPNWKIISWFPHLCYWYNLDNISKCKYWININLLGNEKSNKKLLKKERDYYTNIELLNSFSDIDKKDYYFVLDDLTIKNAINKELINDIINNCFMFYKDIWNYESHNFIWIWKCDKNK